ncbi:MAG TPA: phosphate acyltransferase PlsX [Lentisphaeria bacterium]|nr:phosphate acyltransferase PlsX [Lentisphaeria bacterium]
MKIAVDAMGGDYAPGVVIEGVLLALQEIPGLQLVLVGHQEKLSFYLEKAGLINHPQVELVHAEQVVEMSDHSTDSIRSKKHSSITVCADLVKAGRADAIVSAGHTGAAVAATKVRLRTLEGVDRPALATAMPAVGGKNILIDVGANTDCTPMNLAQFAVMGELYAQLTFGLESPRIGLLSVGGEDVKGNDLTKEVFKILSNMPINFVGNVEGHDIFHKSTCDVIVCDGFTGNSILKASEGLARATYHWLKEAFTRNPIRQTGAFLAKEAFRDLKKISDSEEFGGAPLLGIRGVCIIGHGASTPKAIKNAIRLADTYLKHGLTDRIVKRINECGIAVKHS